MRRSMRGPALVLGSVLVASACGLAWQEIRVADEAAAAQNTELSTAASNTQTLLTEEFDRAATLALLLAENPAYARFFEITGSTQQKVEREIAVRDRLTDQLRYIQTLFPGAVLRSGFVDLESGREIAEVVNGAETFPLALEGNANEKLAFAPDVKMLPLGWAYQSTPYFSKESQQWVIANAVGIPNGNEVGGLVYFETSTDSLRQLLLQREGDATIRAVTEKAGETELDSRFSQLSEGEFGVVDDDTFTDKIRTFGENGIETIDGERIAYVRMAPSDTLQVVNDNDWFLAASEPATVRGATNALTPVVIALFAIGIPLVAYSLVSYWRLSRRKRGQRLLAIKERDQLSDRLADMSAALDRAAAGDLAVQLPVDFEDERLTQLATSFDNTLNRLRGLVGQAQAHGVQLSQAAVELRSTASQQAGSATEQSAVVTETTATIEELAATAAQISETAQSVARVAQDTLSLTDDGRAAVSDAVTAMEGLTTTVDNIAESSAGLGDQILEVGRILEMIDELSEQTNLLALNAAIEAARAGEHGRGFAVVAAEVRKLAERAQQSTSQIQSIVAQIQAHAKSTVLASEAGAREASRGASMAVGAVQALDRIATMVDEATTAAEEISIATQQQRSASDQVVVAMTQVSEVSRQYAAGSRQTESASTEIAALAAAMQDSISTFNVEGNTDGKTESAPIEWQVDHVQSDEDSQPEEVASTVQG